MGRQTGVLEVPVDGGSAALVRDRDRPRAYTLLVDGVAQSYVDLDDPLHLPFEYVRRIGHVADLAAPAGAPLRALHLGGGGLALPRYVAATRPGSRQNVAEVDGALVALVRHELPWPPGWRIRLRVAGGRDVLATAAAARYDLVVVDVFAAGRVASDCLTVQAFAQASRVLAAGGLLALNVADGPGLPYARRVVAAARSVWPSVTALVEPAVVRGRRYGNVVVCACDGELPLGGLIRRCAADPAPARVVAGDALDELVAGASPLTDADTEPPPRPPAGALAWRG